MSEGEMAAWLHVGSAALIGSIGLFIAMYRAYRNEWQHEEEMEQLREILAKEKEEQKKRSEQKYKEFQERRKEYDNRWTGKR
ncbi:hypothetical protein BCQ_PI152 (plasmid) [Bacillus cereus Q1]|uniref:Uncharacterized protein n=1 Tax=Bacillus cereus (strain Q1) TaxID=361100 RepID=B9J691_BACCQ|nr:hypothetical protein [Bacillus paranthracis]ACM15886.1 hypothetical protein BCQ_PI152 [Bacillus cereus Q1]MED1613573.1 hypothetical protein [Bacillus paranthracis]MED1684670.1 hypothetical protein [Bacillus paranthracis]ONG86493.1 hypothetical protein BKK40_26290 [Bacillus cereus]